MSNIVTQVAVFLLFIGLQSCTREFTDSSQLAKYVDDSSNGLVKQRINGQFEISVSHVPSTLLLSREMISYRNEKEFLDNKTRYDSILYFDLKISQKGKKVESNYVRDPEALNRIVAYMSDEISSDIFIVDEKYSDTLRPSATMYVGSLGMSPTTEVMIAFPRKILSSGNDLTFYFDDAMIGSGRSSFKFNAKDIKKVPPLKIKWL